MRHDPQRRAPGHYPFHFTFDPRFGDLDVNAHLNNVAYARFFEEGRVRLHASLGGLDMPGFRPIVANLTVDYLAEGRWPDPLTVGVGIARFGNSSYVVGLALFQKDACIALCDTVIVNRAAEGPGGAALPKSLRDALEGLRLDGSAT